MKIVVAASRRLKKNLAAHQQGLQQLSQYLETQQVDTGYLLIFDTRKEYTEPEKWETTPIEGKTIISAWV